MFFIGITQNYKPQNVFIFTGVQSKVKYCIVLPYVLKPQTEIITLWDWSQVLITVPIHYIK